MPPVLLCSVDRHQWMGFIFVQPWTNLLIMRSICSSDNKYSTFSLILNLAWHRRPHTARLIHCPMSRHPKSNLPFHLGLRYCSCLYTCWLLTLLCSRTRLTVHTRTHTNAHTPHRPFSLKWFLPHSFHSNSPVLVFCCFSTDREWLIFQNEGLWW